MAVDDTARGLVSRNDWNVTLKGSDWADMPQFPPVADLQAMAKFWMLKDEIIQVIEGLDSRISYESDSFSSRHTEPLLAKIGEITE